MCVFTGVSGVFRSAGDVLEMSVVRSVGGVCAMCLARGGVGVVGSVWVRGLGLGFTNPGGTWGKWHMCLCLVAVVLGVVGGGLGQDLGGWGGVVLCVCVL